MKRTSIRIGDNQAKVMKDRLLNKGLNSFTNAHNRVIVTKKDRGVDEKHVPIIDTNNLILYHGRHWLMQRAFAQDMGEGGVQNQDQSSGATARQGYRNKYISWFALGTGANKLSGSPLDIDHPALSDYELGEQAVIYLDDNENPAVNSSDGNMEYGGNWGDSDYKQYHRFDSGFPNFIPDLDITSSSEASRIEEYSDMQANDANGNPNYTYTWPYESIQYKLDSYLIAHVKVTIGEDEFNGPINYNLNYAQPSGVYYNENWTPTDSPIEDPSNPPYQDHQDINEAGLFIAPYFSNLTGITVSDENRPELFARVTFPTIRKRNDRELVFNWYVYF
jgi:hypothetical protein